MLNFNSYNLMAAKSKVLRVNAKANANAKPKKVKRVRVPKPHMKNEAV